MTARRPLWWRWLLNILQFDGLIGYPPAQLIYYILEKVKPSASPAEGIKKKLFIHAAVSPAIFILGLILLNEIYVWEWQVLPIVLIIYFVAISFVDYGKSEDVAAFAGQSSAKEKRLKIQLKSVKLMVVVWALFILSIQFFLP